MGTSCSWAGPRPDSACPRSGVKAHTAIRGTLIYDHPQDYATALQAVASGAIAPEATVRAGFDEEAAVAFAGVRDIPGKSWISMVSS